MREGEKRIEHMKNNKSSGQDGFAVELYKISWNDIKHLYAYLHRSIQMGMLPFS